MTSGIFLLVLAVPFAIYVVWFWWAAALSIQVLMQRHFILHLTDRLGIVLPVNLNDHYPSFWRCLAIMERSRRMDVTENASPIPPVSAGQSVVGRVLGGGPTRAGRFPLRSLLKTKRPNPDPATSTPKMTNDNGGLNPNRMRELVPS